MKSAKTVCLLLLCLAMLCLASCQQQVTLVLPGEEIPAEAIPTEEPSADTLVEWIAPAKDIDLTGLNLYWRQDDLSFPADDNAILSIYTSAGKYDNGEFAFDDGQEWLLVLETSLGIYPLMPRKFIQLGLVSCLVFEKYDGDNPVLHILVSEAWGASYEIYDCVFVDDKQAFMAEPVYYAGNIGFIADSKSHVASSGLNELLLNIEAATGEFLSKYNSFNEFVELNAEDGQKIAITTNVAVSDFRFIEVGFKADGTAIEYFEKSVLYSLAALRPEKPFVVTWIEQGLMPHRGISFIDEVKATRCFYITMSGEDGSLLLVEF